MHLIERLNDYLPAHKIFHNLRAKEKAVFLDSSVTGNLGKTSIIACRPYLELRDGACGFTINGKKTQGDFHEYVRRYLNEHYEENDTELPIVSGAVGYFSYDYGREKAGVVSRHEQTLDIPESILTFYDCFVIEDHQTGIVTLVAGGHTGDPTQTLREIKAELSKEAPALTEGPIHSAVSANFTPEEYMDAVEQMVRYIVDGDIYVVNMTQQLEIQSDCDPYRMFRRLREKNPSPFGSYLDFGDFQIVCASPERFMQMRQGKIKTRPIKGTRKRGSTKAEDQQFKSELANSEKDQSELLMIVDLERNDLNRVCSPGSVKVTELFEVETYATVFHLVANVEGEIRKGCNAMDLLTATFPGGSITGAPKLRAMELIDLLEHRRRNLYTGSIGYLALNGDCDLNIVIRTAVHKDGVYHLGLGGGITCESEPDFEYEETWQKARALLDALDVKKDENGNYEYTVR